MTEPVMASKTPYGVDVTAGRSYWWCACGKSGKQPFRDGSHKDGPFTPVEYRAAADGKVWFCGCKRSGARPLCDGTHKTL